MRSESWYKNAQDCTKLAKTYDNQSLLHKKPEVIITI